MVLHLWLITITATTDISQDDFAAYAVAQTKGSNICNEYPNCNY